MGLPHQARAVGFVLTADRETARRFYSDVLGLTVLSEDPFAVAYDSFGMVLRLTDVAGFVAGPHPVLGWEVPDIRALSRDLRATGVQFEIYDGFGQDDLGIWTAPDRGVMVNWFKDPDGNVLSLTQR